MALPGAPEGILNVTGFAAWGGDRAGLFLDLVRHLYAAPDAGSPAVRALRGHARTVTEFIEAWRAVRAAEGNAGLAHAADCGARRVSRSWSRRPAFACAGRRASTGCVSTTATTLAPAARPCATQAWPSRTSTGGSMAARR